MEPLDLATRPPRSPRVALDGLLFLARSIDKLRASLPGGSLGHYKIDGTTEAMLAVIGVEHEEMLEVVKHAKTDDDVVRWLREHTDTSQYEVWNRDLLGRKIDDENYERLRRLHPATLPDPNLRLFVDILDADDRKCFPRPPFTEETARAKVQAAENLWNARDPERVALSYGVDSEWRNRAEFIKGREQIIAFLRRKWDKELGYKLKKQLWCYGGNRIAVTFEYEYHDDSGQWYRAYGNELWEFDDDGLMRQRIASINDAPIEASERRVAV